MYKHPSTQENMQRLVSFGNHIIEPASGFLASGLEGKGRMEEPERIVAILEESLGEAPSKMRGSSCLEKAWQNHAQQESMEAQKAWQNHALQESMEAQKAWQNHAQQESPEGGMRGKKVLITAGPTYEKIDPVRFIGNYSSGKMGFALAEECAQRGAEVTLVAGPVSMECSEAIHRIDVENCEEMYQAATAAFKESDAAILCAAVADFRPATQATQKIKREKDDLVLRLEPTHDIAAALGKMKTEKQVLVGFALETNDEEVNAKKKLEKKNLDFIVLNSLQNKGTCFQSDENQISIISKEGQRDYEKKSKQAVARDIVDEIEKRVKG